MSWVGEPMLPFFEADNMRNENMAFATNSKTRKIVDYLAEGRTLTAAQAHARFGVQNFSATMSTIRRTVEAYGNWEVTKDVAKNGAIRYGIVRLS